MKKILQYNLILVFLLQLVTSCGGSDESGDTGITPSNLVINHEIVGADAVNVNGDGSGDVNFTVSATNATSYKILIEGEVINSTTGIFTHSFNLQGTNSHTVIVSAYNGTRFISANKTIIVYVTPTGPTMVWSDEFNTDGAPNNAKWTMETGTGSGGWGNNELQYYTNRPENVIVQGGLLKINLIKEAYNGSNYTSARMITKDKYSFKYGRVEFRAKLPAGAGTWPALWMLGSNLATSPWPACGEIDVMEHVGNDLNKIHGTLHHPGHSGGNADSGTVIVPTVTSQFHVYSVDWSASTIRFYVDNQLFYTFANNNSLPFNHNFFLIINCAMGGNFGGAVDPNFTAATLEVDYVRVYQ